MATKKPQQQKSVLSQLQSVGEGAIGKLTQNPATRSALQGAMQLKDRGEQLVSGLIAVEKRLADVEQRLAALEEDRGKRGGASSGRSPARRARTGAAATGSKARTGTARARSSAEKPKPDA